MFTVGILLRALPSIVAELVSLVWYAYRTGDRGMAGAALVWLTSTVTLVGFLMAGVVSAINGGEVHLRGPILVASLPVSMWLARELVAALLAIAGRLLALFGRDPLDASL